MRYDRQMILPEIGEDGQQKLKQAKVLIVGVGGLGSPIALYLTGAGVGCIGLVDDDVVSISNLQRQVLYSEKELGKPKAICAAERLSALNSEITIRTYPTRLTEENAQEIISQYDIVVDGCDNFSTRYLINDICAEMGKVYVYGAICGFEGQVSVFHYGEEKKLSGLISGRRRNEANASALQRCNGHYSCGNRKHRSNGSAENYLQFWRSIIR